MIFIATGANASANNLGKISIKSIDEITPQTIEILNYFGKTWADDQKIALDDFLVSFNASSWKSKVKVLSMPILMPSQNNVNVSQIEQSGSKFRKNLADWNNQIIIAATLSYEPFGYIGVGTNGIVLQNNNAGGAPNSQLKALVNPTSFGITNKNAHYGVFFKSTTAFRSANASSTNPAINSGVIDAGIFSNNFNISISGGTSPKEQLTIINGDVTVPASKSYLKNGLVPTTIVNTQASAVQIEAGLIQSSAENQVNNSTCCLMTFGNYMTDAELLEYSGLINTLMDSLVV
jgi:hypothetical protein